MLLKLFSKGRKSHYCNQETIWLICPIKPGIDLKSGFLFIEVGNGKIDCAIILIQLLIYILLNKIIRSRLF